jgi:hypothetical protein
MILTLFLQKLNKSSSICQKMTRNTICKIGLKVYKSFAIHWKIRTGYKCDLIQEGWVQEKG